jgi:hypothetical protein
MRRSSLPLSAGGNGSDMTEPFGSRDHDIDADHMVETPESLSDVDPEQMPIDRGIEESDRPLGAEKFGTTHAEESRGESLDDRLAEERPDVGEHDPVDDIVAANPQAFGEDPSVADEQTLDDAYGDPEARDVEPDDVGRLVEPDEGAHTDTEKDVVARDAGIDGGDESAEEAALHEIPPS